MTSVFRTFLATSAALALMGTAPETFSRDDLAALEAERAAAISQLEALKNVGQTTYDDIHEIDQALLAAAMETRRREEQAALSERRLIDLATRQTVTRKALLTDEAALEDLLGALVAANRRKPPAMIVSPDEANTAVRRAILMSDTAPRLAARADALSDEIDALNQLERQIRGERARLESAEATLALKKVEIEQLAAVKRANYEDVSGDIAQLQARSERLSNEADTLRDLLAGLEATAPSAPGRKPQSRQYAAVSTPGRTSDVPKTAPRRSPAPANLKPLGNAALGGLTRPVTGDLARAFGAKLPTGGKAEGLTIQTRTDAQVVAPVDGTIEYAKPFRSYGPMLIVRTSDGYHVILMGMSDIYVTEGQSVSIGEPVARMSSRAEPAPSLYMELRHGDKVMNPANWMKRAK